MDAMKIRALPVDGRRNDAEIYLKNSDEVDSAVKELNRCIDGAHKSMAAYESTTFDYLQDSIGEVPIKELREFMDNFRPRLLLQKEAKRKKLSAVYENGPKMLTAPLLTRRVETSERINFDPNQTSEEPESLAWKLNDFVQKSAGREHLLWRKNGAIK